MHQARLIRIASGNAGTFGVFLTAGGWYYSMELPNRDNASNISCIPVGEYRVQRTFSPKFGRPLYLVENVDGRSGIRVHAATWAGDKAMGYRSHLKGCISLGLRSGMVQGQAGLIHSSRAIQALTALLKREAFKLIIQEGM